MPASVRFDPASAGGGSGAGAAGDEDFGSLGLPGVDPDSVDTPDGGACAVTGAGCGSAEVGDRVAGGVGDGVADGTSSEVEWEDRPEETALATCCPGADPDCPGAAPDFPGAAPDCPGADPDCPGADPDCPGADPDCPGAAPDCPGADPDWPGATPDPFDGWAFAAADLPSADPGFAPTGAVAVDDPAPALLPGPADVLARGAAWVADAVDSVARPIAIVVFNQRTNRHRAVTTAPTARVGGIPVNCVCERICRQSGVTWDMPPRA